MYSADSLGHLTSKTNPVLIIDLDETLLSINSFPVWAKYFLLGKFDNLNFTKRNLLRLKSAIIFAKRKTLKHSHAHTKNNLHKLWLKNYDYSALEIIITTLEQKIRPNMRDLVISIASGQTDAVLATAAAAIYAEPLAKRIGFSNVIATNLEEQENRSEEKSRRVLEFLKKQGWENRKKIFFTDHLEDMPFMKNSDKLMWFGKPEESAIIKQSIPTLEIIICHKLSAKEILETIHV